VRILYVGNATGTSLQRIDAFKRLGHKVLVIDPDAYAFCSKAILYKWLFETGGIFLVTVISLRINYLITKIEADLVWVNGGDLISPWLVRKLKYKYKKIINYNNDLPFGSRDKLRWKQYFAAVPYYDLLLARSNTDLEKPLKLGAKQVVAMYMLADEKVHERQVLSTHESAKWASDVLFVGTWFPGRGNFLKELITKGVPITVYGDRWHKAPEWEMIKPYWRGTGLSGLDYTYALQSAKICLGLVSEENNDLHTSRSMEVPALGSLLCAKRTYEHQLMYTEWEEAVFWDDAQECSTVCQQLLADPVRLKRIAQRGNVRYVENGFSNEKFLSGVLTYMNGRSF
jgi:spore maturation protein CgeB